MVDSLSSYDAVILDGFGTLYDKDYIPLLGAVRFLETISCRSILFSNIGSKTGDSLREQLESNFHLLPSEILTSLDFLLIYLKKKNINRIFHYGGQQAAQKLLENKITIVGGQEKIDAIVFTSLPNSNWIKDSQSVLQYLNSRVDSELILANPDRMIPGDHVGINVGMMFDMLLKDWPTNNYPLFIKEIGKPCLTRTEINLGDSDKILVVGDNKITDGGLAKNLDADFCLISSLENSQSHNNFIYPSLDLLVDEFHGK
tara:strand:- start:14256 stop:15029 length:774 start_codon:yes stop_codon:yes gene_type:complete